MDYSSWLQSLTQVMGGLFDGAVNYMPRLLAAVLLLFVGWLVARLFRGLARRTVLALDSMWHRMILRAGLEQLQTRQPPVRFIGEITYWLVILFFVTATTEVLGLGVFVTWLTQLVQYIPVLAAALLIVLAGFVISTLLRDMVSAAAFSAGLSQGDLLGRLVQFLILLVAIILGLGQAGIDVSFLSVVAGIVLAVTLGGVALAFGLGAKMHVANLIAARQLRATFKVGDRVRCGAISGRIIEIGVSHIVIDAPPERVVIPASVFNDQPVAQRSEAG